MLPKSPSAPMNIPPKSTKANVQSGWATQMPRLSPIDRQSTAPITNPRPIPPAKNPTVISKGDRGGISVSTMEPMTFAESMEEEVLAKEFCITVIINKPGARKLT